MRLRLYCDASRGDRPRRACNPVKLHAVFAVAHVEAGLISFDAIDQIYEIRNYPEMDKLVASRDDVEALTREVRARDPRLYFAPEVTA